MPGILTSLALAAALMAPASQAQAERVEWCAVDEQSGHIHQCFNTKRQCEQWTNSMGVVCVIVRDN